MFGFVKIKYYQSFGQLRGNVKTLKALGYKRIKNTYSFVCCGENFCCVITLMASGKQ